MMFTKADIRRISIAVTERDYGSTIVNLGKNSIVHIDSRIAGDTADMFNDSTDTVFSVNKTSVEKILSSISSIEEFFPLSGCSDQDRYGFDTFPDDITALFKRDSEKDLHDTDHIKKKINQYTGLRSFITRDLEKTEMKLREIRSLRDNGIDLSELHRLKYISFLYGRISGAGWLNYIDKKSFYIFEGDRLLVLLSPDIRDNILNHLIADDFENLDYLIRFGTAQQDQELLTEKRLAELQNRLNRIDTFYRNMLVQWEKRMQELYSAYSLLYRILSEESKLLLSEEFVNINGWIDLKDSVKLISLLQSVCTDRFYFNIGSRKENRKFRNIIPVLLRNNKIFRPFELLVRMMGVPGNSEVDPTPVAALAYIIIFGVMFGDAGQGLVLALAGFFINIYGRKKSGKINNISDFGSIMTWCGFSAIMFGFLYGSFFSNEHLLPALLFHPMENMMQLLLMAIMTGAVFITAGLILNIVNGLISGRYEESLFGTRGAAGLSIYISFIYFSLRFILSDKIPETTEIFIALAVPLIVFSIRGPLEYIFFHADHIFSNGIFEYIVETVIEIIEMFSGLMGNTISYIRAGAFALSHAGLSIAVFTLAGMIDPSIKSAGSISVVVLGNIFIILLEGLVCGIQSMRLEYYEFFSKFYRGDGISFSPFSLNYNKFNNGGLK